MERGKKFIPPEQVGALSLFSKNRDVFRVSKDIYVLDVLWRNL